MTQQTLINKIKHLNDNLSSAKHTSSSGKNADTNELQAIADTLTQQEITICYSMYEAENHEEPDSILDALDFIINNF